MQKEIQIKNGNALNDAKDNNKTKGYRLTCLISSNSGVEILYGVSISHLKIELDSFIFVILYPNGKYKITDILTYKDLYSDKIEDISNFLYKELDNDIERNNFNNIFALFCTTVNQIQYVRKKVENITNSQLISAKEASKLYGISCDAARAFIKNNGGTKYGREWMLQRQVFDETYTK